MDKILLLVTLGIYGFSIYYCFNVAKKHNLSKVVAVFAAIFLPILGLVIYSHLNYKLTKKVSKND